MASFAANLETINILHDILINTFNPDPGLRHQAETSLKDYFIKMPDALISLICFVGNHTVHRDLRQAGAIAIKNNSRDFFRSDDRAIPITTAEKESIKPLIIDVLLQETDNSVRGLLAESIKNIAEYEFPERWPNLLHTILAIVQTPDILKMYNALTALRKLVKRYEYKQKDDRKPLYDIVEASFPILQNLMTQIVNNNSIEAAQVMRLVLKIFWSCTNYSLPIVQGVDVNLWFTIFSQLLEKRLPEASEGLEPFGQPTDKEERKNWPWWKVKKWTGRILQHFIQRYGNPQYAGEENQVFATHFRAHTAPMILVPILNTLAGFHREGRYITEDVHRQCLLYVNGAIEMSPSYKLIKPHLDFLIFDIVFPTLCITPDEIDLFQNDPVEFVRKVHNPLEDWLDPRVAATNLLQTLARYRQKDTLPRLLPFCNNVLVEFNKAPPEHRDYRRKDGVVVAIASVALIMSESKKYMSQIDPFLNLHIVPEFQSPVGFMRCRACWAMEYFGDLVKWEKSPQTLQVILQGLLRGLKDPCVPTQAAAACALRILVKAEGAHDVLKPIIKDIVGEYLRIMAEVDNDAVLGALQTLVEEYGEEVVDIAPAVVSQLLGAFGLYASAGEEDDESLFTASQCLETVCAVLEVCKENTIIMGQLEAIITPVITGFFSERDDAMEFIDCAVTMLGYLTYYLDHINVNMWQIFPAMLVAMDTWAYDYMSEVSVPVLNYISKDIDTFLMGNFNGRSFLEMTADLIKKALDSDRNEEEREAKAAAKMLCCIVSCGRGKINNFIPFAFQMVAMRIRDAQTSGLTIRLLEVAMAAIYYDPLLALDIFKGDADTTDFLFRKLFEKLPSMVRSGTQRLIVLCFASLYSVPSSVLPPIVITNLQPMLAQMIREVVLLEETEGDDDEESEDGEDDQDEQEGEEEEVEPEEVTGEGAATGRMRRLAVPEDGFDEDDDCVNVEDEEYRAVLEAAEKSSSTKPRRVYSGGELISDDFEDDEEEEEEEDEFVSPLDNIDVADGLCSCLMIMQQREPQLLNTLRAGLDEEDITRLDSLLTRTAKGISS